MYEETDKMKFLRVQQHYADVLVDRSRQVAEKQVARQLSREEEARFHESTMRQVREAQLKEREDEAHREEQMKAVAVSRTQQREEARLRKEHEQEEQRRLGLAMKEAAEQRVREDIIAREKKAVEIREGRMKTLEKNAELREEKRHLLQLEEEAEKDRERDIAKIEERKKAREDLEKFRFEQAQLQRQKIIDNAVSLLAKKMQNEDEIMERQQKEFNDKIRSQDEQKEAKAKREWEETVASRTKMIESKKTQTQREREDNEREKLLYKKVYAEQLAKERDVALHSREQVKAIKQSQLAEAAAKKKAAIDARLKEREREKLVHRLTTDEDEKFRKICEEEIRRYRAEGKPTTTLLRALRFKQPEILPAVPMKSNNL